MPFIFSSFFIWLFKLKLKNKFTILFKVEHTSVYILCFCFKLCEALTQLKCKLWNSEYYRKEHITHCWWNSGVGVYVFKILSRLRKHPRENIHITGKVFLKDVCFQVWLNGRANYWLRIIFSPCPRTSQVDSMSSWIRSISTVVVLYPDFGFPLNLAVTGWTTQSKHHLVSK